MPILCSRKFCLAVVVVVVGSLLVCLFVLGGEGNVTAAILIKKIIHIPPT